jgi:2-keto-3-deoxy-L-rhamnonate aldolase RhmA
MGLRGNKNDPRVVEMVEAMTVRIRRADKVVGILASTLEEAASSVRLGIQYIAFNAESLLRSGMHAALSEIRDALAAQGAVRKT